LTTIRLSLVAKPLIATRDCSMSPRPPSPMWRLAITTSSRSALIFSNHPRQQRLVVLKSPSITAR